jgi:hypothetical protein
MVCPIHKYDNLTERGMMVDSLRYSDESNKILDIRDVELAD